MDDLKEGANLNNSSTAYANAVRADNALQIESYYGIVIYLKFVMVD
jgi:hypothetical protein